MGIDKHGKDRKIKLSDETAALLRATKVAQISGTSVAMTEKRYGHLRAEVATPALAKLALWRLALAC